MEPLRIFGIPVTRPGYYMNCVLTNAQIELIAADVGVVDYGYDKKKMKKKKKGEFDNTPASSSSIADANKEWVKKDGTDEGAGQGLSANDILGAQFTQNTGIRLD